MSDDPWREAALALRTSQAAAPLKRFLEVEYAKRLEQLVNDNTDVNCGKAQELRKLLRDLFDRDVDTSE